ncbi:unnamed protein product [Medioppia subpectinata]|uniref:C2H2-type domain-containing protein n=1 Tax=Medioppia subpectinata TaxID=1979941 RepID=A0A7R9KJL3_9ACAR|nr:unnamed protein product [Medioppia subpectinata]CAG2104727.1 unnamed protein product [Medioppia subpectinata]
MYQLLVITENDDSIPHKTSPKTTGKTVSKGKVIARKISPKRDRKSVSSDSESDSQSGDDYCNDSSDDNSKPEDTFAEHYLQSIAKLKRPTGGKFVCDVEGCEKSYKYEQSLRFHRMVHFGQRVYCSHEDCNRHFATMSSYFQHKKEGRHVLGGRPYVCGIKSCVYETPLKNELESHIMSIHPYINWSTKSIVCDVCGQQFIRDELLAIHVREEHTNKHGFKCDECERLYASAKGLQVHQQNNTCRIFRCHWPGCEFRTPYKMVLYRTHAITHLEDQQKAKEDTNASVDASDPTKRIYRCDVEGCDRVYDERSDLRAHKAQNHSRLYPNRINQIDGKTSSKTDRKSVSKRKDTVKHEPRNTDIGVQEVGLECDVNLVANEVVIDGTVESEGNVNLVIDENRIDCNLKTRTEDNKSDCERSGDQSGDDYCNDSSDNSQSKDTFAEHYLQSIAKLKPPPPRGQYACDVESCEKSYQSKESLRFHRMKHFGKRFYCPFDDCNQHFGTQDVLRQHKKKGRHVLGGRPYVCGIKSCVYETPLKDELESHIMTTHPNVHLSIKSIACDECGQQFIRDELLAIHVREEHTNKHGFKCKRCERSFKTSQGLQRHRENKKCRIFRCHWPGCQFRTPYKMILYRTHAITHSTVQQMANKGNSESVADFQHQKRLYRCGVEGCDSVFDTQSRLSSHNAYHHSTRYQCHWPGCDFRAGHMCKIKEHVEVKHTGHRPFACTLDGCQFSTRQKLQLELHKYRKHPDHFPDMPWFKCDETYCEYRTKCKYRIATHTKGHTKPFVCDICGKGFQSKLHLNTHRRAHTETIRCSWPGCETVVASEDTMRDHYNTHTKAIVYECLWPGCEKTFLQRTSYVHHKRTHNKDSRPRHRCHWPECDYETFNRELLKRHIDTHNGVETVAKKRTRSAPKRSKRAKKCQNEPTYCLCHQVSYGEMLVHKRLQPIVIFRDNYGLIAESWPKL